MQAACRGSCLTMNLSIFIAHNGRKVDLLVVASTRYALCSSAEHSPADLFGRGWPEWQDAIYCSIVEATCGFCVCPGIPEGRLPREWAMMQLTWSLALPNSSSPLDGFMGCLEGLL